MTEENVGLSKAEEFAAGCVLAAVGSICGEINDLVKKSKIDPQIMFALIAKDVAGSAAIVEARFGTGDLDGLEGVINFCNATVDSGNSKVLKKVEQIQGKKPEPKEPPAWVGEMLKDAGLNDEAK